MSEVRVPVTTASERLYRWKAGSPLAAQNGRVDLPPGPRAPRLWQSVRLWAYRPGFMAQLHREFGDTFTINALPVGRLVVTRNADAIRTIFRSSPEQVRAGEGNALLRPLVGENSVLTLDAPKHQPARKRLTPPFHGARIARVVPMMADATAAEVATWPVDEDFRLIERTQALTLDIIVRVVMGVDDPVRARRLGNALRAVLSMKTIGLAMWVAPDLHRYRPWRNVIHDIDRADKLLYDEIELRRNDPHREQRPDVLSMLVGDDADPTIVRDELVTLLAAGHETTAVGLAWTFERLLRNPAALAKVRAGLDDEKDPYRAAVVKESLRVRPVIHNIARRLMEPAVIDGYQLPAGQFMLPSIAGLHADTRIWGPDAMLFRPDRWLADNVPTSAWIPFGGGTRRCLGAMFAQTEMETVLRTVLQLVDLRAVGGSERQHMHNITVVPSRGAQVRVVGGRTAAA